MKYTTQHIQAMFDISHQTVKNWCDEKTGFGLFLSPSARPESGRQRQFTDDDLRVFVLAADMKKGGSTNEDIRTALGTGQRGSLPESFSTALAPTQTIVTALAELREQVETLSQTIQVLRLESSSKDGQITLLKEQLAEAQADIRRLERENARLSDHAD